MTKRDNATVSRPMLHGVPTPRGDRHNSSSTKEEDGRLFDIDEFIELVAVGSLSRYFEKIRSASDAKLRAFRSEVKQHKKRPQKTRFAALVTPQGTKRFSPHDEVLLRAISWEFTRRSKWRLTIYRLTAPPRRWWAGLWHGADFSEHGQLGHVLTGRAKGETKLEYCGLRVCLVDLLRATKRYVARHHWKIIMAAIAVIGIYATWR